ncbi:MAG: GAF domain-containing protein, partial [Flavobacterium sp.]|nr:GAF domain-containing protein [Flavobacterium sp.]
YILINDMHSVPVTLPFRDEALKRNYLSLMIFPIKKYGEIIGMFCFYSSEINFFDAEEIILLKEATYDVSFALEVIEKEKSRKKHYKK